VFGPWPVRPRHMRLWRRLAFLRRPRPLARLEMQIALRCAFCSCADCNLPEAPRFANTYHLQAGTLMVDVLIRRPTLTTVTERFRVAQMHWW